MNVDLSARALVFSIDDAYILPFKIFFHSLDSTASIPQETPIFILHTASLSQASIAIASDFLSKYQRQAVFLDATHLIPYDLPIRDRDHVSPVTFYRLFIANILPEEIESCVYLDVDMVALKSIKELFTQPLHRLIAAADHFNPADGLRLWGEQGGDYFQAGVLVIPIQLWREADLAQRFLDVMRHERSRICWWDQDVLNIAFEANWQRIPIWFNVCEAIVRILPLDQILQNTRLIHYSGSCKPWNMYNPSPLTFLWDQAYQSAIGEPFDRQRLKAPFFRRIARAAKVCVLSFFKRRM